MLCTDSSFPHFLSKRSFLEKMCNVWVLQNRISAILHKLLISYDFVVKNNFFFLNNQKTLIKGVWGNEWKLNLLEYVSEDGA